MKSLRVALEASTPSATETRLAGRMPAKHARMSVPRNVRPSRMWTKAARDQAGDVQEGVADLISIAAIGPKSEHLQLPPDRADRRVCLKLTVCRIMERKGMQPTSTTNESKR
jgi:hypothetical protein